MRKLILLLCFCSSPALALDKAAVEKLATGETDERAQAISTLVTEGDPKAAGFLEAVAEGDVQVVEQKGVKRVLVVKSGQATDAITGGAV